MAKQNVIRLYGRVTSVPKIARNTETGEYMYAVAFLDVVRGTRAVGDNKQYVKHDGPMIITKEEYMIREIETWQENDVVDLKGIIVSKDITKKSKCPHCLDDNGEPTINVKPGTIVYVDPIHVKKIPNFAKDEEGNLLHPDGGWDNDEAEKEILRHKEISNDVYCIGTVIKEPRIFRTKSDVIVCDYQVAINRKYHIRTDDPSIRTDWIWIKSYGERAIEDKLRLMIGSDVYVDGILQTRNIKRKTVCPHCGQEYIWVDRSAEIVPYAVEYGKGTYKTDDVLKKEDFMEAEQLKQIIYDKLYRKKAMEEEDSQLGENEDADGEDDDTDVPVHLPTGDIVG